jgi:hypothetical protein
MRRQPEQSSLRRRRNHRTTISALAITALATVILFGGRIAGGARPRADGATAAVRDKIMPVEQTRTLHAESHEHDYFDDCDEIADDGAEGFEAYENTIEVMCANTTGRASQKSAITQTYLSADGHAFGDGVVGPGHDGQGSGESVFEVVFDSSTTQWCTLSGVISIDSFGDYGAGFTEVMLTGPDEVLLFEARLDVWAGTLPFSEEFLLSEGGRYTLRAVGEAASSDVYSIQCEYSVLLVLNAEVPTNDVGVLELNHPPANFPAGDCAIDATIANYGSEDQDVTVHCEAMGPDIVFLDEGFGDTFPPPGWSQEQGSEWQLHEGNEAGGAAPEAWLDGANLIGDYAFLDSAPVDTTDADRLLLEFKHRLEIHAEAVVRVWTRPSREDGWTNVTPWPEPVPLTLGPERVRIDITHDIGPATQVRFEYDSDAWVLSNWWLNDVKIYDVSEVYSAEALANVPALSQANVEFEPAWGAPEGLYLLEARTELPGDEHPENDGLGMMITVEPATQYENKKLLASDGEEGDWFGIAVAIDGEWAIVGACAEDTYGILAGAAYVYHFDGSEWIEMQKLLASDGAKTDSFGASVVIDGDIALIAAPSDSNANGSDAGAVYVFRRDGSTWLEETKLLASDGLESDRFGAGLDLEGDLAIIGSSCDDENGTNSGSAYVFRFDGTQWTEGQKLLASDGGVHDYFGEELAVRGDLAVIGARAADNENGADAGAAYVFRRIDETWEEEARLLASDGDVKDWFGVAVTTDGQCVAIGAPGDDDLGDHCGAAYVFRRDRGAWIEEAKLLATDGWVDHEFGTSIAAEAGHVVVGAYAALVQGCGDGGSAYIFTRKGSQWPQAQRLLAHDVEEHDFLGDSVAISGSTILVGARGDDDDTGAACVFAVPIAGDIDGDGDVDTADLLALLAAWGDCPGCPEDIDGDGVVDTADLLILLGNWG